MPSFLRGNFVPLYNFQAGDEDFNNTCFIAVVANLRHLLLPVMNSVSRYRWKDYIKHVRRMWNNAYCYGPVHNGQHDAAELLGGILHDHCARFGVELCVTKHMYDCNHCMERLEYLPMIVLTLPSETGRFSLRGLRDNYFAPVEVNELECAVCGLLDGSGICTHTYKRSLSGKIIFRINRYSAEDRRSDPIVLDEKLTFENGDEYRLEAILQHEGESIHGGHYIIFLRLGEIWECRNDDRRTFYPDANLPPYSPENVYVVVYGLTKSPEGSVSIDFWKNIPEEPVREDLYTGIVDLDFWADIPEEPNRPYAHECAESNFWDNIPEDLGSKPQKKTETEI